MLPVQILASLLRIEGLRNQRFTVAGVVLARLTLSEVALVVRADIKQRVATAGSVEVAQRILNDELGVPCQFHASRNFAEFVCNASVNAYRLQNAIIQSLARIVANVVLNITFAVAANVADVVGGIRDIVVTLGVVASVNAVRCHADFLDNLTPYFAEAAAWRVRLGAQDAGGSETALCGPIGLPVGA